MYICLCNAIRDCEIRVAARTCVGDAESLYTSLGRPPQCRQCLDDANAIMSEERCGRRMAA